MCILFWSLDNHCEYKFIFAANRDEHLSRPTSPASWWCPDILSGLDLQKSERGTWLGISRTGRFAAVTNYVELETNNPEELLSRGAVVRDVLESDLELEQHFNIINDKGYKYGGFNLIGAELGHVHPQMFYLSNRKIDNIQRLNPGKFYGLSNSLLEDPWPKVKMGISELESIVEESSSEEKLVERLFGILSITVPFESKTTDSHYYEDLKKTIRIPKLNFGGDYATRTSTVILVDHENNVVFVEKTLFDEECRQFRFRLSEAEYPSQTRTTVGC